MTMIDMWDLLNAAMTLYGLLTWPIYEILQKPWVKEADRTRRRAVIEPAGHGRLRYSHDFHGTLDEAVTYVQSRPNGTLVDLLDWVCSKHENRYYLRGLLDVGFYDVAILYRHKLYMQEQKGEYSIISDTT